MVRKQPEGQGDFSTSSPEDSLPMPFFINTVAVDLDHVFWKKIHVNELSGPSGTKCKLALFASKQLVNQLQKRIRFQIIYLFCRHSVGYNYSP